MNEQEMLSEIKRLQDQVNDLQSGMYINCVYCGHRYGPRESTPVSMADVLKEHVEQCPKHPMSALKDKLERINEMVTKCMLQDGTVSDWGTIVEINKIVKEK